MGTQQVTDPGENDMKAQHRIRIRINTAARWQYGTPRYSLDRAYRDLDRIRQAGHVAHLDHEDCYR